MTPAERITAAIRAANDEGRPAIVALNHAVTVAFSTS